jgi:hypothetical protein
MCGEGCAFKKRMFGVPESRSSFDAFEMRQGTPCGELLLTTRKSVRDFVAIEQYDSALLALQYYTDQCGSDDYTYRLGFALEVITGTFAEKNLNRSAIEHIISYRNSIPRYRRRGEWGDFGTTERWYQPPAERTSLDKFARRVARIALDKARSGSIEQLLCDCFSGDCDSVFTNLRSPRFAGSRLREYYEASVREVFRDRNEGHFAMYSGCFSPSGSNEVLGNHPLFGVKAGGKGGMFALDIVSEVRILDAPKTYIVEHDGRVDTTKQFLGYYAGLELGRELFHTPMQECQVRIGAGFDGFGYGPTQDEGPRTKVHGFNFNVGAQYKWFLGKYRLPYVGLEGLYNVLSYDRNGGDQLKGNAFEVRVLFGWSGNTYDNRRLRDLDY